MKTYIINLKQQEEKRKNILRQCDILGPEKSNIEIFEAVNGSHLTEEQLSTATYAWPNCGLTKGEIGCALSHIGVYKKFLSSGAAHALVLEDDALLLPQLPAVLADISASDNPKIPTVYLLSRAISYFPFTKRKLKSANIYKTHKAVGTSSYVINRAAAQLLEQHLYPVFFVADDWEFFKLLLGLQIYCVLPFPAADGDPKESYSSIKAERQKDSEIRTLLRKKKLRKKYPQIPAKKILYRLWADVLSRKIN